MNIICHCINTLRVQLKEHSFKRGIYIAAAIFITAGVISAQPRLTIEGGAKRSLGVGVAGKVFVDTLVLKNTGSGQLRIIQIDKTCGCTTVFADTNVIPAGQSIRVAVTISPPDAPGEISKTIVILTNDLSNPSQVVEFLFRLKRSLGFVPPHVIAFAGCRLKSACDTSIQITNETDSTFVLTRADIQMPGLRSLMHDSLVLAPHDTIEYRIEFNAPRAGYQSGKLKLLTTSGLNPSEDYDVYANAENPDGTLPPMQTGKRP